MKMSFYLCIQTGILNILPPFLI